MKFRQFRVDGVKMRRSDITDLGSVVVAADRKPAEQANLIDRKPKSRQRRMKVSRS